MNFFKRIKNLWRLSEYHLDSSEILNKEVKVLVKDFPTIKKRSAVIIKEKTDFFEDDKTNQ